MCKDVDDLPVEGEQGNQDYSLTTKKNWILPTTGMSLEVDFPPEPPEDFAPRAVKPAMLCRTSDLQNSVLTNECCFSLLSLWQFVTQ